MSIYLSGSVVEAFLGGLELRADKFFFSQLDFGVLEVPAGLLQPKEETHTFKKHISGRS